MESSGSATRLVLLAAFVAGLSYYWAAVTGMEGPAAIAWKGAGVGLLAVWCAMNARGVDGWLIALVMALGVGGDVLLEINFEAGAGSFLLGHLVAVWLYLRNRRASTTASQKALALILVPAVPLIAASLPAEPGAALPVGIYAAALGAMAACAWISRFPRYRVGLGAMLFVISDLLIFARMGPLADSFLPTLLVWPTYFIGQSMIAMGVVQTLREGDQRPAS